MWFSFFFAFIFQVKNSRTGLEFSGTLNLHNVPSKQHTSVFFKVYKIHMIFGDEYFRKPFLIIFISFSTRSAKILAILELHIHFCKGKLMNLDNIFMCWPTSDQKILSKYTWFPSRPDEIHMKSCVSTLKKNTGSYSLFPISFCLTWISLNPKGRSLDVLNRK